MNHAITFGDLALVLGGAAGLIVLALVVMLLWNSR